MSKVDKLRDRLLSRPSDFRWSELTKLLTHLGYVETQSGKTSGSRVRFVHAEFAPISLHKPHPKPVIKKYMINQIIESLRSRGQL